MATKVYLISLLLALSFSVNLHASSKKDDIRVVIDVSGSMKKTDPSNLRASALKLLNGVIPDGAKAGVWTFGKYTNQIVKWGTVNDAWRKSADQGAEEIHSNALLTNIESALDRSTASWENVNPETRRSLILLTDGQVDISKNSEKNESSRQTIFDKSIQKLRQAGVQVHAIGLSRDVDEVLLKRLALETNGSFEIAETAQDLQKIFFKMFERAVQPDVVELKDNQFKIDSQIEEMTLLIFHKPDGRRPHLFSPEGEEISARRPGKANWRSEEGYDLITVKEPKKGLWTIEAEVDPDNRVMVVTDLKLEVSELPVYITPSEAINLSAALFNKEKQIRKNSFLRFVDFNIVYTGVDGEEIVKSLKHSEDRAEKGLYKYHFNEGLEEGKHSILVSADSKTFNRSKRIDLTVQWPAKVSIEPSGDPGSYLLSISAREEYLDVGSMKPTIKLESPDKSSQDLELTNSKGIWQVEVNTNQDGIYRAWIKLKAKNQAGESVSHDLGAFSLIGVYRQAEVDETRPVEEDSNPTGSEVSDETDEPDETENREIIDNEPDWVVVSIVIGVANLALVLIGVGVVLLIRRKPVPPEFSLD